MVAVVCLRQIAVTYIAIALERSIATIALSFGVPPGSSLVPLLFAIYVSKVTD